MNGVFFASSSLERMTVGEWSRNGDRYKNPDRSTGQAGGGASQASPIPATTRHMTAWLPCPERRRGGRRLSRQRSVAEDAGRALDNRQVWTVQHSESVKGKQTRCLPVRGNLQLDRPVRIGYHARTSGEQKS